MKDYTESALRDSWPQKDLDDTLAYCLKKLFQDNKHTLGQEIVKGLTFEELIGTLLQAEAFVKDEYDQY